jgi:hypothetical protein
MRLEECRSYDKESSVADAKELARARRFVRKNQDRYLEQGLRAQLEAAGYTPQTIEAALGEAWSAQSYVPGRRFIVGLILAILGINVLVVWQSCDLVPWMIVVEVLSLGGAMLPRPGADAVERAMQKAVGRGCMVGVVLSLPLLVAWMSYVRCGPVEQPAPPERPVALAQARTC